MAQQKGIRLEGRNGEIWARHVAGWTQERIADEYDISQQRVSRIISEIRNSIPEEERKHLIALSAERLDRALAAAFDVLGREHYVVNGGCIVHEIVEYARDDDGNYLLDKDERPKAAKLAKLIDDGPTLAAIDRIAKLDTEYRKLFGLDAPTKTEHSGEIVTYRIDGVDLDQLR
jgi:transcriptional regulator with XRE-family HTH domain